MAAKAVANVAAAATVAFLLFVMVGEINDEAGEIHVLAHNCGS